MRIKSMDEQTYSGKETASYRKRKNRPSAFHLNKGFTQIDYIIATGIFLVVFALVIQYVGNFFGGIAATTTARLMTTEATDLLSIADDSPIPDTWPYFAPDNDVVLYMHLDNSTLDSSRYGNNGVASGSVDCAANITGRLGSACRFNSTSGLINVANAPSINLGNASFTISFWIKSSFSSNNEDIMRKGSSPFNLGGTGIGLRNRGSGNNYLLEFTRSNGTAVVPPRLYVFAVLPDVWNHIVMSYNLSSGNATVHVNGRLANSTIFTGNYTDNYNFEIGHGTDTTCNGTIDEVVIFNRSLSADEVKNLYTYESALSHIGLMSKAYRFTIVLNNSRAAWRDQSKTWVNITDELVRFNYTDIGLPASVSSTTIYDDSGTNVPYNINGSVITFVTPITVNSTRNFTVYFDDDENFIEKSTSVTGFDNLTERLFPAQRIDVIQYKKIMFLNSSNYALVKNATGTPRDFRITLLDLSGSTVFTFGPEVPDVSNIFATRRFVVYQNSTGAVRRGSINIQVW